MIRESDHAPITWPNEKSRSGKSAFGRYLEIAEIDKGFIGREAYWDAFLCCYRCQKVRVR